MKNTDNGGQAYPRYYNQGMTLLDHTAIEIAKARIIHSGTPWQNGCVEDKWAEKNYILAEAMIKAKRDRE